MTAGDNQIEPRTVVDPTTGRPILMAERRQGRPMHTGDAARRTADACPFCTGNEAATPPEVDAVRAPGTAADTPGWIARAVPNKYPANRHHEVLIEGRDHFEHPCDLDDETWRGAVALWRRRIAAIEARGDVQCAYWFKNVGARAGASIAHNHSQVLGLEALPPRLELERAQQRELGACPWSRTLSTAEDDGRLIYQNDAFAIISPDPPKMPFESWLLPKREEPGDGDGFFAADEALLAAALRTWLVAIGTALDRPALNMWLHRVPPPLLARGERFRWHFELQPRTGQLAGLELGGDMYINSVPARQTAERLRAGLPH